MGERGRSLEAAGGHELRSVIQFAQGVRGTVLIILMDSLWTPSIQVNNLLDFAIYLSYTLYYI